MSPFRPVTAAFAVAPQLTAEDLAVAAAAGFRCIVNNRPDGEQPGQPSGSDIAAAAADHGLSYAALPIAGGPRAEDVAAMARLLAEVEGPILAYCRSGTRSVTVWALAQASTGALDPDAAIAAAAGAGYDLAAARPLLAQLHDGRGA